MAAPDSDTLNYWLRGGTVLPPYERGNVKGTANMNYWSRGGSVMFPAAIQSAAVVYDGFFLVFMQ